MNDHHPEPPGRRAAARLLRGDAEEHPALGALLASASAPATPAELAGEDAAVAAFRAAATARPGRRRRILTRLLTIKVSVVVVALGGGAALAAGTGYIPGGGEDRRNPAPAPTVREPAGHGDLPAPAPTPATRAPTPTPGSVERSAPADRSGPTEPERPPATGGESGGGESGGGENDGGENDTPPKSKLPEQAPVTPSVPTGKPKHPGKPSGTTTPRTAESAGAPHHTKQDVRKPREHGRD